MPDPAVAISGGSGGRHRRRERRQLRVGFPRWFWPAWAAPGTAWMALLFVVPFYAIVAVAFGDVDPVFRAPVPVWNPLRWNFESFRYVVTETFGNGGIYRPALIRTFLFVGLAVGLCLLIGYPVAYFIARYGGRFKTMLVVALVAPFFISYLMRMLAWVNLLQDDGLVNSVLVSFGLLGSPKNWLDGQAITVVLALVYGYIPYMILPLFGALDRIDPSLLEASRDLGASRRRTFTAVTLPLSRQAILAGTLIVSLPMFGDYYTADLMSGSPRTTMVGNLIDESLNSPFVNRSASLVLVMVMLLFVPMVLYMRSTARAERDGSA